MKLALTSVRCIDVNCRRSFRLECLMPYLSVRRPEEEESTNMYLRVLLKMLNSMLLCVSFRSVFVCELGFNTVVFSKPV